MRATPGGEVLHEVGPGEGADDEWIEGGVGGGGRAAATGRHRVGRKAPAWG